MTWRAAAFSFAAGVALVALLFWEREDDFDPDDPNWKEAE